MNIIKQIKLLGQGIDKEYMHCNYDSNKFSRIAKTSLESFLASSNNDELEAFCLKSLIEQSDSLEDLINPEHTFGDSRFTIYKGQYFSVEINVWQNLCTAIHEHSFSGAFTILKGKALHAKYRFLTEEKVSHKLQFGRLEKLGMQIIKPGVVEEIFFGEKFIHNLIHTENPTLTLIVRTYGNEPVITPQRSFKKRVAIDGFYHSRNSINALNIVKMCYLLNDNMSMSQQLQAALSKLNLIDLCYVLHQLSAEQLKFIKPLLPVSKNIQVLFDNALDALNEEQLFIQYRNKKQSNETRCLMAILMTSTTFSEFKHHFDNELNNDKTLDINEYTVNTINNEFKLFDAESAEAIIDLLPELRKPIVDEELMDLRTQLENSIIRVLVNNE